VLTSRLVTRFILEFGTAVVANGTALFDGDLTRGMIYFSIQHSNVEHLSRDRDLAWRYSSDLVPDNQRRPITVHALSQVLGFSPETTRRHVKALEGVGACVRDHKGVIVPERHMTTTAVIESRRATIEAFDALIAGFKSIGFPLPTPEARDGAVQDRPPIFLVIRLINAYILRMMVEAIAVYGDATTGILFAAIMGANTRALSHDTTLTWRFAHSDSPPPDEAREPVTVAHISELVRVPYSTVNRRVGEMIKAGLLERRAGGVIVPTSVAINPAFDASGLRIAQWLAGTFRDLAALGYDFSPLSETVP
jgi:DNA-binding Lrp family transcriptional regulator